MSVEAIVRVVEAEAAAEAERIVDGARARAAELVADAEATVAGRVREACERAEPAFRAEATRQVNAARVRLLEGRAARAADLVDAVVRTATTRLVAIVDEPGGSRWERAVTRLVEETAAIAGAGSTIHVRPADAGAARPVAQQLGCRLVVTDLASGSADGLSAGVVGWSADGRIEVDATLRSRLERARGDLAEPLARLLDVEA